MGKAAPKTAVWMGPGVAMNPRGTYTSMMVHALNGLVGSVDVEGGTLQGSSVPTGKFASTDKYVDELAKHEGHGKKIDMRGDKNMPAMMGAKPGSGVVTNNVANGMLKDPGAIKVLMSTWSNFNFSCTDPKRWDRALAAMPFFVHLVTNPSEMTQFADVVLPATFNSSEGMSIVTNMGNGYGYAAIQQPAVKPVWDVKQEETEVMWLLAAKLRDKGFANLYDYYSKEFKDPETGKTPANEKEFGEIAAKIASAPMWMPKEPLKGDQVKGWDDFRKKGMYSGPRYTWKKGWGGKFATATKKFEFYSETLKKGLQQHAEKHKSSVDEILEVSGYVARGDLAFMPHYEPPKRHGSLAGIPVHLHRLQVAAEPGGPLAEPAVVPGVQEGRSRRRLLGRCPQDEPRGRREARTQVRRHGEDHLDGGLHRLEAEALGGRAPGHGREMLRPGALGLRSRGHRRPRQGGDPRRKQQRDPGRRL